MSDVPNRAYHPGRQVGRGPEYSDPYDAYRDRQLESGAWQARKYSRGYKEPEWKKQANRERYQASVTAQKAKNAMWPGLPVEHGPPKP